MEKWIEIVDWLFPWFYKFEIWLGMSTGYASVIVFEDVMVFLFGVIIGGLIMTFLVAIILKKSKKVSGEQFNKISLIKFIDSKDKGNNIYFFNDGNNFYETFVAVLIILFSPLGTIKTYTKRDEKRTKIIVVIVVLTSIFISLVALLCITTILAPDDIKNVIG